MTTTLVDQVQFPEGGKMQISPKPGPCSENEVDIRNQRPRLRRNKLILVEKPGVVNQLQLILVTITFTI